MSRDSEIRGIDQMLALADGGQYLPVLHQDVRDLVEATRNHALAFRTKAKCKLTLTVELIVDPFGQIDMSVEHKLAEPKAPKSKAVAWATEDGALTVANPAQRTFDIREVDGRREFRSPDN